jgi:hypothetical protein
MVLMNGLRHCDDVALVTVTAPGTDFGLAWDPAGCSHPAGEKCSGKKGCRVVPHVADRWNANAESNFSRMHRAAAGRVRRRFGSGSLVAAKTWELQRRGLLHLHMVVPYRPGRERARADQYVTALKEIGGRYGFGFSDLKRPPRDHHGGFYAAAYAAKYVGKATSEKSHAVKRPAYVGRWLTALSGVTMRALRWRRYLYRKLQLPVIHLADLRGLIAWFSAFPDLELVPDDPRAPPALSLA